MSPLEHLRCNRDLENFKRLGFLLSPLQLRGLFTAAGAPAPKELDALADHYAVCCGGVEVEIGEHCPVCGDLAY